MAPNKNYNFFCEKGKHQDFLIKCNRMETLLRIFVIIDSTSENFEVFVSREQPCEKKADFSFKTNRFFIKYRNFNELQRIFLSFSAKEKMKYEISLKFILGLFREKRSF